MIEKCAVVFDDDDLFRDLFVRIFKRKQIQATAYADPVQYFCCHPEIKTCPVERPCTDFLLTDHMMSGMTGLEFLKLTRQMACKIPEGRKAIISANWTREEYEEAKRLVGHVFQKSEAKQQISDWIEATDCQGGIPPNSGTETA